MTWYKSLTNIIKTVGRCLGLSHQDLFTIFTRHQQYNKFLQQTSQLRSLFLKMMWLLNMEEQLKRLDLKYAMSGIIN